MARAKMCVDNDGHFYGISFRCPGCAIAHISGAVVLPVRWLPEGQTESTMVVDRPHWDFNGNFELPTFSPSVLSHYDMPEEGDDPAIHFRCHSFVRNGRIEFLSDCTHALDRKSVV